MSERWWLKLCFASHRIYDIKNTPVFGLREAFCLGCGLREILFETDARSSVFLRYSFCLV